MIEGRAYFIGAGPGDPAFLTLMGVEALDRCQAAFVVPPYDQTYHCYLAGKSLFVPFAWDFIPLRDKVLELLQSGNVAFLVPGDLSVFCPFQPLLEALGSYAEVIPGVAVMNAASALLKKTLTAGHRNPRVIQLSTRMMEGADPPFGDLTEESTLVVYMNTWPAMELGRCLRQGFGKDIPLAVFHRLGLPGETVLTGTLKDLESLSGAWSFLQQLSKEEASLTLVIAGESLSACPDGSWWDHKREQSWRHRYGSPETCNL
ncbi:MAG: SAM-dependent methyltransferase [Desulfuromonadales bacterium]|nr:SAM-dependent methyltransferase [Desulfuromonadales bacterium]MDW7756489.1 SAM-dependent methyltransferase [Desulfuromonadales bacterium]